MRDLSHISIPWTGKAWDAENKEVADLKPKVKPFDRVLVRDSKSDNWRANLFGSIILYV